MQGSKRRSASIGLGFLALMLLGSGLPAAAQPAPADSFWERVARKGQSKLKDIELYGRVEDQHGQPVPGVEIVYDAGGLFLASSSGRGTVRSDAQGRFKVQGARGVNLWIAHMKKPGYLFRVTDEDADKGLANPKRFGKEQWKRYTPDKPAVFVLWKVDRYPAVNKGSPKLYMTPGQSYTIDFLSHPPFQVSQGAAAQGDISVQVQRSDKAWSIRLVGIDGGLQEQIGPYPFLAPETGYAPVLEYRFAKQEQGSLIKRLYFSSRRGTVYGFLFMDISPYFSDEQAGILFWAYVVNTEKGRDLTVPAPASE